MRNYIFITIITLMFCACSSPDKEGKALGSKYCDCLGDSKPFTTVKQFKQRKDSCDGIIKGDWTNYESKYKQDAGSWKAFIAAFQNTTQKTTEDFNVMYSKVIINDLGNKLWMKDNEVEPIYLYSFYNNTMKMPNCKGEFEYKLSGDTLLFSDEKHSKAIIEFTGDDKFTLLNPGNNQKASYHIAQKKERILGKWYFANGVVSYFKPNGTCTLGGEGYSTVSSKYSISDDLVLAMDGNSHEVKIDNIDTFSWGLAQANRMKSPKPDNLKILFTTNN